METITQTQITTKIEEKVIGIIAEIIQFSSSGLVEIEEEISNELSIYALLTSYANVTEAEFKGNYLCPPDPPTVTYSINFEELYIYDSEDGTPLKQLNKELVKSELLNILNS